MPRRRHKYRPKQQEKEKPAFFFAKDHGKEPIGAWQPLAAEVLPQNKSLANAKMAANDLLETAKCAIQDTQPEEALANQSKALEWYNQIIEADVSDIEVIQETIEHFCEQLQQLDFSCGHRIIRPFGQQQTLVNLGASFHQLNFREQVKLILRAVIQHSPLPERQELPAGQYEQIDLVTAWTDYLFSLLNLLPEQPYLLTGTTTNILSSASEIEEIEEDENDEDDTDEDNPPEIIETDNPSDTSNELIVLPENEPPASTENVGFFRRFFNRLFGRD